MSQSSAQKTSPSKGLLSSIRLLEIAARLFREKGYASTSMRDIAQEAGMKAGSLYYHFNSKDEILDVVLGRGISEAIKGFREAIAQLGPDASFSEKFEAVICAHFKTIQNFGNYTLASRQLLSQIPDELRDRHLAVRQVYDELWHDLIRQGCDEGAINVAHEEGLVRMLLLGSMNWASEWADPAKKSPEELAELAADLFINGLAHRSPGTRSSIDRRKKT